MRDLRKKAKEITYGIIDAIFSLIVCMIIINLFMNFFDIGLDPTDKDGFNRSGLSYYKDYGTGKEYISSRNGCLIERIR